MKIRTRPATFRVSALTACCALASVWMSGTAFAQAAATPPAPPTQPPATPPAPPTTPATAPAAEVPAPTPAPPTTEAAPAPAPAPAPEPAVPPPAPIAEAPPPEPPKEEKLPSIDVGGWLRVGMMFQGSSDPKKLNDQSFDTVFGELHTSGKVHKLVGWTLNLAADALARDANPNNPTSHVAVEDLIIQLDLLDEFHIWAGQTLVPVDRTNFSGPFFISPWTYTGVFAAGGTVRAATPMEGPFGRNIGATIWGDVGGTGTFKYFASMMNMNNPGESPLFSGRLAVSPVGGEPGLWGSSTFYGEKDVLTIGVGAQYKHDGSVGPAPNATTPAPTANYSEVNADVLAEFRLGDSGTITGEGGFYHFGGDYEKSQYGKTSNMFYLLGSYLTPKVGPGGFQPMVRYQRAWDGDTKWSQIEGHVAYVVKGAQMRGLVGFRHVDIQDAGGPEVIGNAVEIGLQTIMF